MFLTTSKHYRKKNHLLSARNWSTSNIYHYSNVSPWMLFENYCDDQVILTCLQPNISCQNSSCTIQSFLQSKIIHIQQILRKVSVKHWLFSSDQVNCLYYNMPQDPQLSLKAVHFPNSVNSTNQLSTPVSSDTLFCYLYPTPNPQELRINPRTLCLLCKQSTAELKAQPYHVMYLMLPTSSLILIFKSVPSIMKLFSNQNSFYKTQVRIT